MKANHIQKLFSNPLNSIQTIIVNVINKNNSNISLLMISKVLKYQFESFLSGLTD